MKNILLACLFLMAQPIVAQNQKHLSDKKLEALAAEYYRVGDYTNALIHYKKLDSIHANQPMYNYRIGICIFNSEQKGKALRYFQKAKEFGYTGDDIELYLARCLHLNHLFDEAIAMYQHYTPDTVATKDKSKQEEEDEEEMFNRGKQEMKDIKADVSRYIRMCELGKQMVADSLELVIENIGAPINSKYPDFVPVVSADETELIFTSRRPNTTGGNIDPQDNHYFEDVYISVKDSNGNWTPPKDMGPHVNSPLHDASVGLSPDGHKLFIYRSEYNKRNSGDIYVSNLEGAEWTTPEKMGDHINSPEWEPSASISSDEKTLFFVSDRPGGLGGTDIYMVTLQEDLHWSEPVNLGPGINTPYDEDAPYIHPDNKTLFFSSRGHSTMGGFDIFTTVRDSTGNWAAPENAGYPINTADDDIYFIWSADGTKGYFSSWRDDSYGEKDIYVIHRPKGTTNLVVFKGRVFDSETRLPLGSTIVIKNIETNQMIGVYNSNSITGKFSLALPHGTNYSITVEADGYVFHSSNIHVEPNSAFFEVKKDIYLDPIKAGKAIVLNNIFFHFDKATLRSESTVELENLYNFLVKYPELRVELAGHTDSYGSDVYNQKLSQRRAEAVVNYLVKKGIPKNRLVAKGYGESSPVATNETDEGRQINRRTELKIIDKDYQVVNNYDNTPIQYKNEFTGEVDRSGVNTEKPKTPKASEPVPTPSPIIPVIDPNVPVVYLDKDSMYIKGDKYYIPLKTPESGTVLKPKVHFLANGYQALTDYSMLRITEVAEIMKAYPYIKVKVVAYYDEIGSLSNKELAVKRAKTVYNLLIKKGINPARLITGTQDVTDTEEGVEDPEKAFKSRKVEFVVQ